MNAQDHARFQSLYQRYLTELTLRGKSDKTIDLYARCLRQISEYFDTCPDQLGTDQLQQYFMYLPGITHPAGGRRTHQSDQKPRDTHLVDFRWSGPRRCGSWRLLLCRAGQGRLSSVVGVVGVGASGQLDEGAQVVGLQVFFAQAEENLFGYAGASQT
jgi:hypothetical protein